LVVLDEPVQVVERWSFAREPEVREKPVDDGGTRVHSGIVRPHRTFPRHFPICLSDTDVGCETPGEIVQTWSRANRPAWVERLISHGLEVIFEIPGAPWAETKQLKIASVFFDVLSTSNRSPAEQNLLLASPSLMRLRQSLTRSKIEAGTITSSVSGGDLGADRRGG
jgi:hypothetical protein